jgi:aspartate/methionine/tyrosine aminotransferase
MKYKVQGTGGVVGSTRPRYPRGMKSSRRGEVSPFYVMEVMKAAERRQRTTGDVLHLEVGQPSTAAPEHVRGAARSAIDSNRLGYTDAAGIPELRRRISLHYRDAYGVTIPTERITITVGASGGFVLTTLASFDAGARVAITQPGYAAYRNILTALDVTVVPIPVGPDTRFNPTPRLLDAAGPLDGLVVASPANPTGTILRRDEMAALTDYSTAHGLRMISDEIYHGITYGLVATTAAAYSDSAVVVQSFSKYYSMTGWRLGWLILPEDLIGPVERLAQNLFISPPTLSQIAAVSAFGCADELDANVARYSTNRDLLMSALVRAGIDRLAPAEGAFYVYADVSHLTDDSQELCRIWLDTLGIAATPGIDFDPVDGHRYVRFSYAESTRDIAEAASRLVSWAAG